MDFGVSSTHIRLSLFFSWLTLYLRMLESKAPDATNFVFPVFPIPKSTLRSNSARPLLHDPRKIYNGTHW